ncbi:MAG: carboxypeptidase regulatory-like domain-containing protein [Planctomycetia bacterium]|nr:carboxypeptidase regulatory-like domain-containing protein [Planctomycetia bacterium]
MDHSAPGHVATAEPVVQEALPGAFSDWLDEVRVASDQTEDATAPSPRTSPRRRRLQAAAAAAAIFAAAIGTMGVLWALQAPTGEIRGRLLDAAGAPLPGVKIFLATDPRRAALTDAKGAFLVTGVPLGRQSLVATVEHNVGQEYVVKEVRENTNDVGPLTYDVPPLSVRLAPGSGKDWRRPATDAEPGSKGEASP